MRDHAVDGPYVSADDARRLLDVEEACRRHAAPAEPGRTAKDVHGWFAHPPGSVRRRLWLATDTGGTTIGAAWLTGRIGQTATARLMVVPALRGTGVGSRLFAALTGQAGSLDAPTVLGLCDDEASVRFLSGRGGRPVRSYVRQALELDAASGFGETGAPDGLAVASWATAPEALLASYVVARNAIKDAPADEAEILEWTGRRVRELERALAARERDLHVTVLLDGDRVVAFTELRVSRERNAVGFTDETAVVPAYRGRGLAKRLKAASLRELAVHRPDVRRVMTTNEVTNAPMLAVNRAAGFVPVATRTLVRLDLPPGG